MNFSSFFCPLLLELEPRATLHSLAFPLTASARPTSACPKPIGQKKRGKKCQNIGEIRCSLRRIASAYLIALQLQGNNL
jgi:hypothetical protein